MRFDIISLFPESFTSYFDVSILKRAQAGGLIEIQTHQLRDFTHDKHQTVDDTPYGGGAGMVLRVEPIAEAIEAVQRMQSEDVPLDTRTILFSAKGKMFTQKDARRLTKYKRLILVCGRYEGVDERVVEHLVDEELSVGDYVLTGGEIPAMVVVDAVARLLPHVLGNTDSIKTESHSEEGSVEYPQYTKPEVFRGWQVPDVLLSGHHAEIAKWREEQAKKMGEKRSAIFHEGKDGTVH